MGINPLAGFNEMRRELHTLRTQTEKIRQVHTPIRCLTGGELICAECGDDYPCPTMQILDGTEST